MSSLERIRSVARNRGSIFSITSSTIPRPELCRESLGLTAQTRGLRHTPKDYFPLKLTARNPGEPWARGVLAPSKTSLKKSFPKKASPPKLLPKHSPKKLPKKNGSLKKLP